MSENRGDYQISVGPHPSDITRRELDIMINTLYKETGGPFTMHTIWYSNHLDGTVWRFDHLIVTGANMAALVDAPEIAITLKAMHHTTQPQEFESTLQELGYAKRY